MALYDLIRIFRRIVPHGTWAVAIQDVCYWLLTAFLIFQLLYRQNDGAVRGYALFAVGAGMLLYHRILGSRIVEPVSGALKRILGIVLKPFRSAFGKIVQVVRVAARFYKKKLKKKWKEFIMILFS